MSNRLLLSPTGRREMRAHHRLLLVNLGRASRDVLCQHVDGPVPIILTRQEAGTPHAVVRKALISRGLIRFHPGDRERLRVGYRPRHTVITRLGRELLAALLADEIDAMLEHP